MGKKKEKKLYVLFETKGYRILAMEDCLVIKENFYPHNFSIEKALDENEGAYVIAKSIINFIENANEEKNARKSMFREVCFVSQGLGSICKEMEVSSHAKKKEILDLIELEMSQFYGVSTDNYRISYKKYQQIRDDEINSEVSLIRAILFPKKLLAFMESISRYIGLRIGNIVLDTQILEKIVQSGCLECADEGKEFSVIESRSEDIIVSTIEKGHISKSIVVVDAMDDSLIDYLRDLGNIIILGNRENAILDDLTKKLHFIDSSMDIGRIIGVYEKICDSTQGEDIFRKLLGLDRKSTDKIYNKIHSKNKLQINLLRIFILYIVLILLISVFEYKEFSLNIDNLDRLKNNNVESISEDSLYMGKGSGNIYGVDIMTIKVLASVLGNRLVSIDSNKDNTVFEFKVGNMEELRKLMSNEAFKKSKLVYIKENARTEEIIEKIKIEDNSSLDLEQTGNVGGLDDRTLRENNEYDDGSSVESRRKEKIVKKKKEVVELFVKAKISFKQ